jgi:cytochrome c oxidase subunit III
MSLTGTRPKDRLCRKMPDVRLATQFGDLRQQHEVASLGMWVFIASEVLFFGGLILAYATYRHAEPVAFAEAARHTRILIGSVNTAILLTSSFLVAWAVDAAKRDAGRATAVLLSGAAVLGVIFLVLKGIEYQGEVSEGLFPRARFAIEGPNAGAAKLFFTFYFVATGLHAVHVGIGIVVLGVIAARARQGAYSEYYHSPITVGALYWHFVDLVWIVLFALIYLPGRA